MIWLRNPPATSHMGGVWERKIRTARSILNALIKTHGKSWKSLDDESLYPLFIEVWPIVNSQPITISDLQSPLPISPSNLLTKTPKVIMLPPQNFCSSDVYSYALETNSTYRQIDLVQMA